MHSIHTCKDGLGVGVSDLIGFVKESQPAESDSADGQALRTTGTTQNSLECRDRLILRRPGTS